ncbi:MAG: ATP-binding protein [Candidatus Nanohaloarchaea archaeon]|nr:ATP-binding protein [Candidatus Nanohaloarchaea archaeon]
MEFKSVLAEQREELKEIEREEKIIRRDRLSFAEDALSEPNILAVIGVRRCGKSIFSYLAAKQDSFGYINFDDERLRGVDADDLNRLLQACYSLFGDVDYVVLDEPQHVEGWEMFANRLRRTKRVIVTGSSADLLSGELASRLTGRYILLEMYPFSFQEYLEFKGIETEVRTTKNRAEILDHLTEYMEEGGFPEVQKFGRRILNHIYKDIITKDVVVRHGIRKKDELSNLAHYLVTNISSEISYSKLKEILEVNQVSTVSNWVSYLEDAFLIRELKRFSYKLKEQIKSPRKVYAVDPGLARTAGFTFMENRGPVMENVVYVELLRRHSTEEAEVYYWKDHQGREVDFVINYNKGVDQLLQVTYADSREDVRDREIDNLLRASEELDCNKLLIITWDCDDRLEREGKEIVLEPIWKWLLTER